MKRYVVLEYQILYANMQKKTLHNYSVCYMLIKFPTRLLTMYDLLNF